MASPANQAGRPHAFHERSTRMQCVSEGAPKNALRRASLGDCHGERAANECEGRRSNGVDGLRLGALLRSGTRRAASNAELAAPRAARALHRTVVIDAVPRDARAGPTLVVVPGASVDGARRLRAGAAPGTVGVGLARGAQPAGLEAAPVAAGADRLRGRPLDGRRRRERSGAVGRGDSRLRGERTDDASGDLLGRRRVAPHSRRGRARGAHRVRPLRHRAGRRAAAPARRSVRGQPAGWRESARVVDRSVRRGLLTAAAWGDRRQRPGREPSLRRAHRRVRGRRGRVDGVPQVLRHLVGGLAEPLTLRRRRLARHGGAPRVRPGPLLSRRSSVLRSPRSVDLHRAVGTLGAPGPAPGTPR
jgi:hypothetical protein